MRHLSVAITIGLLSAFALASFTSQAQAADVSWTIAETYTDGSPLPQEGLTTEVEYGICGETPRGVEVIPAPGTTTTIETPTPGRWCFRARHVDAFGSESVWTGPVEVSVAPKEPSPPSGLTVAERTAYTVVKRVDRFVMVAVGTVPAGTECLSDQSVNGLYVVPRSSVTWSGNVRPEVVVANCS